MARPGLYSCCYIDCSIKAHTLSKHRGLWCQVKPWREASDFWSFSTSSAVITVLSPALIHHPRPQKLWQLEQPHSHLWGYLSIKDISDKHKCPQALLTQKVKRRLHKFTVGSPVLMGTVFLLLYHFLQPIVNLNLLCGEGWSPASTFPGCTSRVQPYTTLMTFMLCWGSNPGFLQGRQAPTN